MMLRCFVIWLVLLAGVAGTARAQTPVCPFDTYGPTACFRVYDTSGQLLDVPGQPLTVLCSGATIRLRDCSGENFPRTNVNYALGCNGQPDTLTSLVVPTVTAPTSLIIVQATPNPRPGTPGYPPGTGQQFSRRFEVRPRPVPTFSFSYCGTTRTAVFITITNAQANIQYEVQVGNGPRQPVTNPAGATYVATPGATSIVVYGNYRDARVCEGVSQPVPYPAQPTPVAPVLQRLTVQNGGLSFSFAPLQAEYRYVLEQDGGSGFQYRADIPASATSYTLTGGSLSSCYRLRLTDACGLLSLPSAPLCPVDLRAASTNRQNQLTWTQPAGSAVTGYTVLRDGTTLATVAPTGRQYLDAAVACGATYRYQVVAVAAGATSESAVQTVQTVADQAPPPPPLSASFRVDGRVEINLLTLVPANSRLQVQRSQAAEPPATVPATATLPLLDTPAAPTLSTVPCYSASLSDACGNASAPGPSTCPPVLAAEALDPDGNRVGLSWAAPAGQGSSWTYQLLLLDAEGQELSRSAISPGAFPVLAPTPPADRQVLRYRLQATASSGLIVYSNVATVTRQLVIAIPNAFTPNGDGLNDVLEVKGRFLKTYDFKVFDRNGVLVFRGTDRTQTWDGRIRGVQAAPQAFPYQFETIDETGRRLVQRGTVTILR